MNVALRLFIICPMRRRVHCWVTSRYPRHPVVASNVARHQNRGQLAAGMTSYQADRADILKTVKDVGTVSEVFRLSHRDECEQLMQQLSGPAAIGHVRYATCGKDDRSYAQPFERQHIHKRKWFSFCFNGQLANYNLLRDRLLANGDHHLARQTDTEIILHEIGRLLSELSGSRPDWVRLLGAATGISTAAYSLALLSAHGGYY